LLDTDGRVVDRRRELSELRAAAETAERGGGACVLLGGVPGVGKSTLLQAFGSELSGRNCIFAYGRCQDGAPAPYAAVGDALASLVRSMEATEFAERDRWRADLASGTSPLTGILGTLVPDLVTALGTASPVADLDAADTRHRLHRAAIRLVSAAASYRTVVLTIDDLQWADRDSMLLLSELLTVAPRNVLVVGAHRTGEFDPAAAGIASTALRCLHLQPLARADVEDLLAAVVGRGIELSAVATEFQHRTGGNPLQIRQLLYRAQREGALVPIGEDGRPGWDLRLLSSIEFSATEAEFLGQYLDQLRPIDRTVLSSLSCIGGEFDLADATAASAQPPDVVARALWSSLELRLLEALDSRGQRIANAISRDARYRFSHDRVAEAARAGLPEHERRETHLRLGRRLVRLGDDRLFEAARHVGIGGRGLDDPYERIEFVDVLQRAARRARAQASFPLVLTYSRNALELLGEQRWTTHFETTRELQLDAADAALLVGELALLHDLLDEAELFLREPVERARLAYLRIKGRFAEDRLQEAMDTGLRALTDLGEPLPPNPGKPRMANALLRMRLTMSRWTNERLLGLPQCEDRLVIEKLRILVELCHESYNVRPNLFPLFVRKQLELTLAHGHTPSSPCVLSNYGLLLVILGDLTGSQRFGEVGVLLAERPEFRDARPRTLFNHLSFIHHWRHPVRAGLGLLRQAVGEALDQGDQESAGLLIAALISQSFWVGRPLAEIDVLAQSLVPQIRSQALPNRLCQAMQQMALNLMGRSDDPFLLAGESGFDEREVVARARIEGDEVLLSVAATMKQGLHFWAGDHTGAAAATDDAIEHIGGMAGTAISPLVYMIGALSMMRDAPRDRSTVRFVRRTLTMHRKYAEGSPENYAASYALIRGAWARVRLQHATAEQHLHQAIELAERNQLPMIGARAYEELAAVYTDTGRTTLRDDMIHSAYQRWLSLGVAVRTDWLAREHPWLLSRDLVHTGSPGLDPFGAHQLFRALSGARNSVELANIILRSVADTTGAGRVLLFSGVAAELWVQASYDHGEVSTVDGPNFELPYDRDVVRRVLDSATPWTAASVIVVPILLQNNIIGVIYAEQDQTGRHFTSDHEEVVAFLCAQAAAPLSNFRLEARLKAADEDRQSLIDAQSRFLPNELLRILDIEDLSRVRSGHRVEREMTVLISDIRGYTTMLEDMNVSEAGNLAMGFLRAVELPIISCNGFVEDVRGDEIVAVFESEPDAVRAGLAMLRSLREHNRERLALGSEELRAGIGINTGTVGVGLVCGVNRMVLSIIGDAVNLAARIESTNKRYGSALLISDATRARLDESDQFEVRRMERVMVVNRRRPVTIHEVYNEDSTDVRAAKRSAQPLFDEAFALFDTGEVDRAREAFERCRVLLPDDPVAALHLAHCDAVSRGEMTPGQEVVLHEK
jgi:predicted ATPase/class 3 adenylate cyclase